MGFAGDLVTFMIGEDVGMNRFNSLNDILRDGVGVIELNRPKQLNSLNRKMVSEIVTAMEAFDHDDEVITILVTGKWPCIFRRGRY